MINRRLVFGLVGFFFVWGVFGFAAGAPRSEPRLLATVAPGQNTPVVSAATEVVGIPVTGEVEPVWTEVVVFYGLIALTAILLIMALLESAGRSMAPSVPRKDRSAGRKEEK